LSQLEDSSVDGRYASCPPVGRPDPSSAEYP
jgi:hypothetical protein